MLTLSPEVIKEFKQLYKKEYEIKLTDQEAEELGSRLIRLVKAVYYPTKQEKKK